MHSWQLISSDGSFFREPQTYLSTVELPIYTGSYRYESCLFAGRDSEVVARYTTLNAAVAGHNMLSKKYGLR